MIPTHLAFAELTRQIIGSAYEVRSQLGRGFLEKVYAKALWKELNARGVKSIAEAPVRYKDEVVGLYFADTLVEDSVICEVKAIQSLLPEHQAQLLNYLKATGKTVGLLINFGEASLRYKRMVFGNSIRENPR